MAKKRGMSTSTRILLIFGLLTSIVFMSTTIILGIGMLPTIVAVFIDRTSERTRGLTVGAMNLAGCMPFLLKLWTGSGSAEQAFSIITDPRTVIVMYCAAGVGYVIDWAVSGLVSSIMVQAGTLRAQQIVKRQADLVQRWGREVTGDIATDQYGFPLDPGDAPQNQPKSAVKP